MTALTEAQRAQVRACAVVMQSASDVLADASYGELSWRLKTTAVAIYQQFPQPPRGELPQFDAELRRRIDKAVPVAGIAGTYAFVHGEQHLSEDEAAPSLLSSGMWDDNAEINRSHL